MDKKPTAEDDLNTLVYFVENVKNTHENHPTVGQAREAIAGLREFMKPTRDKIQEE